MAKVYSKEYYTFMDFINGMEEDLDYYASRLQDEWQYEKMTIANIIRGKLETLGTTEIKSTAKKVDLLVQLGNDRVGLLTFYPEGYTYGVKIVSTNRS